MQLTVLAAASWAAYLAIVLSAQSLQIVGSVALYYLSEFALK